MSFIVTNLKKSFKTQKICRNFDLSLSTGELALLVGASGSGKTTILRMINNLEDADKGTIEINGVHLIKDGEKIDPKKYQLKVGLVFQDYQLFPHMTVLENIIFAARENKLDTQDNLIQQAEELLSLFDMSDKVSAKPHTISGGQKQRVAIMRALMMDPELLCFDEPTSALDIANTKAFVDIIQNLRKTGMMIIIVTHDTNLVAQLAEEAKVIESSEFIR